MDRFSYVIEPDVDVYGFLHGGDELLPTAPAFHRWHEPYPLIETPLEFTWEHGSSGLRPNVFHHSLLSDFVCDRLALQLLQQLAVRDIRVLGRGFLDGEELSIVQVTAALDVVDESHSIPSPYSWARISFPHIPRETGENVRRRIFRVPNPELSLMVLVGDDIKRDFEGRGLRGWRFEPAQVEE